jgi:hypothetical protein
MSESSRPRLSRPRNLFLDTSVFVRAQFNFDSRQLQAVRSLVVDGRIAVLTTEITLREVRARIRALLEDAAASRVPWILRRSSLPDVQERCDPIDVDAIERDLLRQLDEFLASIDVHTVPLENSVLPPVLDKYFNREPPFGVGKNKAEFPDAFALAALEAWCGRNDSTLAVVSFDTAMLASCPAQGPLFGYGELARYLDEVASEDEALSEFVREAIWQHEDEMREGAREAFSELEFTLTDQLGAVGDVHVSNVEFMGDAEIVYLIPTEAMIVIPVDFSFSATATVSEVHAGWYTRNGRSVFYPDETTEELSRTVQRPVAVDVTIEDGAIEIRGISIDDRPAVGVTVYEDDDPWS